MEDKEVKAISEVLSALEGLEGPARDRVMKYVMERLGASINVGGAMSPSPTFHTATSPQSERMVDIRTLKEEKAPTSAIQMAILVGYYLQEIAPLSERKDTFGTDDVEKYFKQASFRLPAGKNGAKDTLNNAKKAGYLETVGIGEYRLNPVGYNLIAHGLTNSVSQNVGKKKNKKKSSSKKK